MQLNLVDRLYLCYLAAVAGLAIWGSHSALRITLLHCALAAAIVLLAMNAHRSKVIRFLHDWYPLAMFIFSFEEIARFAQVLVPHWQDAGIIALEQRVFSTSPNSWAKHGSRLLSEIIDLGYFSYYPLFPVVAGCLYARKDRRPFHHLVLAAVWMYLISFCVYIAFPVEGPRRALPGFHAPPPGKFFRRTGTCYPERSRRPWERVTQQPCGSGVAMCVVCAQMAAQIIAVCLDISLPHLSRGRL